MDFFSFFDNSINFGCKYPRKVNVDDAHFEVIGTNAQSESALMSGTMPYKIEVNVADTVGDMTAVTISSLHAFTDRIQAKYVFTWGIEYTAKKFA